MEILIVTFFQIFNEYRMLLVVVFIAYNLTGMASVEQFRSPASKVAMRLKRFSDNQKPQLQFFQL